MTKQELYYKYSRPIPHSASSSAVLGITKDNFYKALNEYKELIIKEIMEKASTSNFGVVQIIRKYGVTKK